MKIQYHLWDKEHFTKKHTKYKPIPITCHASILPIWLLNPITEGSGDAFDDCTSK